MTTKINIKGPIIPDSNKSFYDYFDMPYTSPTTVTDLLVDNTDDVELIINSNGGDVDSASEIYTTLKAYTGKVTGKIFGMAASAASLIAMAADTLEMSPTATLMIHSAGLAYSGNEMAHEKVSEILKSTDKALATAYADKSGKPQSEILDIMHNETFYNADAAKEAGLIDSIMFDENEVPALVNSMEGMIPQQIINKFQSDVMNKQESINISDEFIGKIADEVVLKLNTKPTKAEPDFIDPFGF